MISFSPAQFRRDPRGNKLVRWTAVGELHGHVLWLGGPSEVVDQVCTVDPRYVRLSLDAQAIQEGWTHALRADGPVRGDVAELLTLLQAVLSLPSPACIDTAIALDWYKHPDDAVDPLSWPNTEIGELIYRGKYVYRHRPRPQAQAGRELVRLICNAVRSHPCLRQATIILDVPGHDSAQVSFGSRLAESVARALSIPMTRTSALAGFRPPAKGTELAERRTSIEGQFVLERDLRSQRALIVDDVYRSGISMAETGRAARAVGAVRVDGIVPVRTLRAR
jgi:Phosphoribosyl transferase domain